MFEYFVYNSLHYTYSHWKFSTVLHARDQYIKHSCYTIIVLPDNGLIKPKHVGVIGVYNIIANLVKFCVFVGLNYGN